MQYELSNGQRIELYGNTHTAKFLFFVFPRLHVNFVGPVPHITMTPDVIKLNNIKNRLDENRKIIAERDRIRREVINGYLLEDFDDDIPF